MVTESDGNHGDMSELKQHIKGSLVTLDQLPHQADMEQILKVRNNL